MPYRFKWRSRILALQGMLLLSFPVAGSENFAYRIDVDAGGAKLSQLKNCSYADWKEDRLANVYVEQRLPAGIWQDAAFSFVPERDSVAELSLRGPYHNPGQWVYYDDVRINGELLPGGDFESDRLEGWSVSAGLPRLVNDPGAVESGRGCLAVDYRNCVRCRFPVEAGKTVRVAMRVCPTDHFSAVSGDIPLLLRGNAGKEFQNRRDPGKNMTELSPFRRNFAGMTFQPAVPEENGSRPMLLFQSPFHDSTLTEFRLQVPEKARDAGYLYLLHGGDWNALREGTVIGEILLESAAGETHSIPVRAGIELAALTHAPARLENAQPGFVNSQGGGVLYVSCFPLPGKALKSIRLKTKGDVPWLVAGATLSSRKIDFGSTEPFVPDDGYKPVDFPVSAIEPGSAIDLSGFTPNHVAGAFGRAVISPNGGLAFEQRPGEEVRLLGGNGWDIGGFAGFNEPGEFRHRNLDEMAERLARAGYRIIRPHLLDSFLLDHKHPDALFDPDRLALVDYAFAALKKHGIYLYLDITDYQPGFRESPWTDNNNFDWKALMYLGDPVVRDNWRKVAEAMLNHVNPHTGLAWKDDPQIVCLEFYNEPTFGLTEKLSPEIEMRLNESYRSFLRKKYRTIGELNRKWNTSFREFLEIRARMNDDDYWRFTSELSADMTRFCKETVRTIGYRGLCAQENFSKRLAQASVRAKWNDAVAMNSYWAHPVPIAFRRGSRISQESAVVSGADYFTGVAQTRLLGRPLFETEYCHSFWNRYEYEQILFPAYAAFQGFSGIMVHELPVVRQENRPLRPFSIDNNPTQRATQFLAACFYQRGDIHRSGSMVTVGFRSRDLEELDLSLSLAASQRKIALLTGFSLDFKDSRVSGQPSPQLEIAPFAGGQTITRAFFNEIADGEDSCKFDLAEFVRKLRAQKIFRETNQSDPARGIFHSDTEQLFLDTGKGVLKIITPYSEGATLVRRGSVSLAALEEVEMPEPGLIGIASVDGLPLQESGRMVLVAVLSCVNSGMKLTADRTTVLEPGTTPVLLQTGTFHLKFRGRKDCDYTLYPLSVNGIRREPIPVENQNGSVSMQIDTAALRDGPTVFFELCAAAK